MPVIPEYDTKVDLDPGKAPQIDLDTSQFQAAAAAGRAIQGLGATVGELFEHIGQRQEQADRQTSGLAYAGLRNDLDGAFDTARQNITPNGAGFLDGFSKTADEAYAKRLEMVPAGQREQFAQRWAIERENWSHKAAEAEYKQRKDFDGHAIDFYTQDALKQVANNPDDVDTIVANGLHQINDASPGLTQAEKLYAGEAYKRQVLGAALAVKYRDDPDGLARELGMRGLGGQQGGDGAGRASILKGGPAPGASGRGLINAPYTRSVDAPNEGGPTARDAFNYAGSIGASRNEALLLTGAAANEGVFVPNMRHDGGIGLGLFGHNGDRLKAMQAQYGPKPTWQQQMQFALQELRSRPEGKLVNAATTPEQLADAEMHYEQPRNYTSSNPRAGENYTGRLNTLKLFSQALGGDLPAGEASSAHASHTSAPGHPDSPAPDGVPALPAEGGLENAAGPGVPSKGMGPAMPAQTGGAAPAGAKNGNLMPYLAKGKPASNIEGLNTTFAGRLQVALENAPEEVRRGTVIGSGHRGEDEQAVIYAKAVAEHGADARKWAAPPGHSNHNKGLAADLGYTTPAAREWWHANAGRFGLKFPLGNEDWHIEPTETRGGGHPPYGADNHSIVRDRSDPVPMGGSPNPRYASLTFADTQQLLSNAYANRQRMQRDQDQAAKADSYNTTRLAQDDIASITKTGRGVEGFDPGRVGTVLGPQKLQEYEEQRAQAYDVYKATSGMQSMSNDELAGHAEQFRPTDADAGAGYTRKAALYEAVHKQADDIVKQRAEDPAAAVADAPNVRQAMQSLGTAPTLQAREDLIGARFAAQAAVGVPKALQSPITVDEAKVYAAKMRPLSSGQAEAADQEGTINAIVKEVNDRYGRYAPDVLRRIMYSVTMKQESADLLAEAMERMSRTSTGPLVTTPTGTRAAIVGQADAMATQSGAATPAPRGSSVAPIAGATPKKSFLQAQDVLRKDPSLLPLFIQKYGIDRVPSDLRQSQKRAAGGVQ